MASKKTSKKPRRARKKPTPRRKVASSEKPQYYIIIEKEGDQITSITSTVKGLKVVTIDYLMDEDEGNANFRMGGLLAIRKIDKVTRASKEIVKAMLGDGEPVDDTEYECPYCHTIYNNEDEWEECQRDHEDEEDEEDEDE